MNAHSSGMSLTDPALKPATHIQKNSDSEVLMKFFGIFF